MNRKEAESQSSFKSMAADDGSRWALGESTASSIIIALTTRRTTRQWMLAISLTRGWKFSTAVALRPKYRSVTALGEKQCSWQLPPFWILTRYRLCADGKRIKLMFGSHLSIAGGLHNALLK